MRTQRIQQALSRAGKETPRENVEAAVSGIWNEWQATYWDKNADPGFDAQMAWLLNRLGVSKDDHTLVDELRHAYIDPIFAISPVLDPDAIPALTQLEARGLRLGLICNTSVTPGFALRRLLAGWSLDRLLSVQLFSDELRRRKPAPEVFHEAARQLDVELAELLHVGDSADADIEGATAAGARALLVGAETPLAQVVSTIQTN